MRRERAAPAVTYLHVAAGDTVAEDVVVVRVVGELDAYSARHLPEQVLALVGPAHTGVIMDLVDTAVMSAAGVRGLAAVAAHLAESGRRMLIAGCAELTRGIIHQVGIPLALDDHPSVRAALNAYRSTESVATGDEPTRLELLRHQARNLPGLLQTRPLVAGSIDELRARYRLDDAERAFELLRESSQRYNLKVRTLALAFIAAPSADPRRRDWFGGRIRRPAPAITFAGGRGNWHGSRSRLLTVAIEQLLSTMDSDAAYLQLADRFLGGLRLEKQLGLPAEFDQCFAYVEGTDTPCGAAYASGHQVDADLDEADAQRLDPFMRSLFQQAEMHSVHSVPLPTEAGRPGGVVSTLHRDQHPAVTRDQRATRELVTHEIGAWLDWYQHTVVLDALEHLHQAARAAHTN